MTGGGVDVLLTGGSGQVGRALLASVSDGGVQLYAPSRAELDLADPAALARAVAARPWAAVINAGAYTAVDRAETERSAAWAANAAGPAALAAATATAGIPLVHISTDYVFSGDKDGFYDEDDPVGPLGVYGASKAAGELAVRVGNPCHVILRTAWVVSATGANFIKTMLRLGAERSVLRVVDDQHGAPTGADDIAAAVLAITRRLIDDLAAPTGTYHLVNAGETSWCGLAREVFQLSAARGGPAPAVEAITTADYPTPARRPANSRLSTAKLTRDFGLTPRPWQAAVADIVTELVPISLSSPAAKVEP